jgi:hypothetical protein
MKIANHNVVILKRFNKKPLGLKTVSKNIDKSSQDLKNTKIFDEHFQIGSALPKSTLTFFNAPKPIRPPSEIFAQPILRAAFEIDMQTASIPWEDYQETLKISKTNLTKVKEIYRPLRKNLSQKILHTKSEDGLDDFLKSHRSSIREEIKQIFEREISKQESPAKVKNSRKSFSASFYRPKTHASRNLNHSSLKPVESITQSLSIKKFENIRTQESNSRPITSEKSTISTNKQKLCDSSDLNLNSSNIAVRIKKRNMIITESASSKAIHSNPQGEFLLPAPFAGKFKGRKIQSKFGAMFVPLSLNPITPNHFLNSSNEDQMIFN